MAITSKTGQPTDKSKPAMLKELASVTGMSVMAMEDMPICWIPLVQTEEVKNLLADVANARSTKDNPVRTRTVALDIMLKALANDTIMMPFRKEAQKSTRTQITDLTLEDLIKEEQRMAARSAKIAEAKAKLEALQGKAPKK